MLAMEARAAWAAAAEVADEAPLEAFGIIGNPGIIIGLKPAAAAPPNSECAEIERRDKRRALNAKLGVMNWRFR